MFVLWKRVLAISSLDKNKNPGGALQEMPLEVQNLRGTPTDGYDDNNDDDDDGRQ